MLVELKALREEDIPAEAYQDLSRQAANCLALAFQELAQELESARLAVQAFQ